MRVYSRIVIDMATMETVSEESYEYRGPIALCADPGAEDSPGAGPNTGPGGSMEGSSGRGENMGDQSGALSDLTNLAALEKKYGAIGKVIGAILGFLSPIPGGMLGGGKLGEAGGKAVGRAQLAAAVAAATNTDEATASKAIDTAIGDGLVNVSGEGSDAVLSLSGNTTGSPIPGEGAAAYPFNPNTLIPGLTKKVTAEDGTETDAPMSLADLYKGRYDTAEETKSQLSDIEKEWDEFADTYVGKVNAAEDRYKENVAGIPKLSVKAPTQFGGATIPMTPGKWMTTFGNDLDNLLKTAQTGAGIESSGMANRTNNVLNQYAIETKKNAEPLAEVLDFLKLQKQVEGNLKEIEAKKEDEDLLGSLIPAIGYGIGELF